MPVGQNGADSKVTILLSVSNPAFQGSICYSKIRFSFRLIGSDEITVQDESDLVDADLRSLGRGILHQGDEVAPQRRHAVDLDELKKVNT